MADRREGGLWVENWPIFSRSAGEYLLWLPEVRLEVILPWRSHRRRVAAETPRILAASAME